MTICFAYRPSFGPGVSGYDICCQFPRVPSTSSSKALNPMKGIHKATRAYIILILDKNIVGALNDMWEMYGKFVFPARKVNGKDTTVPEWLQRKCFTIAKPCYQSWFFNHTFLRTSFYWASVNTYCL